MRRATRHAALPPAPVLQWGYRGARGGYDPRARDAPGGEDAMTERDRTRLTSMVACAG
jgi:hypothetical protein